MLAPEVGAAIAAYEWNGEPVLRPTPDDALAAGDVRRFASYPLLPFSNRIAGASLHCNDAVYTLRRYLPELPHAIHGNGWRRSWSVVECGPSRAMLELVHSAQGESATEWPFAYHARQTFALSNDTLVLTLSIVNAGNATFPFGLGWHPFFPRNAATTTALCCGRRLANRPYAVADTVRCAALGLELRSAPRDRRDHA